MKKFYIAFSAVIIIFIVFTVKNMMSTSNGKLVPFAKGEEWGYKNTGGKVVIKPKFEYADKFYDGRAVIVKNGRCGYIDKKGNIVIKVKYYNAKRFSEGLAQVGVNEGGLAGYINKKGHMVIKPLFESIIMDDFTGMSKQQKKNYINFGLFKNGEARVCVGKKFFIINRKGIILRQVNGVY